MWERFDQFADLWTIAAQDHAVAANAARRDGDGQPEQWVCKLRTELAQSRGSTDTGSVIVLQRSSWVPPATVDVPAGIDPADTLALIDSFPEHRGGGAWATWWLTFLQGRAPHEWNLARAETQDRDGHRVAVPDLAPLQAVRADAAPRGAWALYEAMANTPAGNLKAIHDDSSHRSRKLAHDGRPFWQFLQGLALLREAKDDAGRARGMDWLERAAQRGLVHALLVLSRRLAVGDGLPRDPARAAVLAWRAAAQGKDRARALLGDLAEWGIDRPEDAALRHACYRAAAEQGYAPAQWRLADLLRETTVKSDIVGRREARLWARRAAMAGDAHALSELYRYCDWEIPMTPQPGDEPWPGECRALDVAAFKRRVSRASEHDAVQAMLRIAEMLDDILAAGTLSPRQAATLVDMGISDEAFQWYGVVGNLKMLQARGIDVSGVLVTLAGHAQARGRVVALESLKAGLTSPATIARVLEMTRDDRNAKVQAAAQKAGSELR
jgi:TPR repeat protein